MAQLELQDNIRMTMEPESINSLGFQLAVSSSMTPCQACWIKYNNANVIAKKTLSIMTA